MLLGLLLVALEQLHGPSHDFVGVQAMLSGQHGRLSMKARDVQTVREQLQVTAKLRVGRCRSPVG